MRTMGVEASGFGADGNTLSGNGRTNAWDSQNRLVSCTLSGSTSTYKYGADGLRRQKTTNGASTDSAYDATMMVREGHASGGSLTPATVTATYLIGARGPEYRRDDTQSELDSQGRTVTKARWYVYDGLGSVVGEVDPLGNLTSSPKYDVYGAVRANAGTATSKQGFVGSLGHVSDAETGLIYMRARYYDPAMGRFASEDPSKNGSNWFAYCNNSPVNEVDANGKNPILIYIGVSALVTGALSALSAPEGSRWSAFIRGCIEGAVVSAATCLPGAWGIVGGAFAGGAVGVVDALMTGGNPWIGGIVGLLGGGLGGVVSVEAAAEERSLVLYLLMSADEGAVVSDVNSGSQFFNH